MGINQRTRELSFPSGTAQKRRDVLDGIAICFFEELLRGIAEVRRQHDIRQRSEGVIVRQRFLIVHVETGADSSFDQSALFCERRR
jgi:hypothetical protein